MLSKLKAFTDARPRSASWIFLAIGMVVILIIAAPKDGSLTPSNWAFLIIATIGLAGLCAWIIGWEDGEDPDDDIEAAVGGADVKDPAGRGPKTPSLREAAEAEVAGVTGKP